MEGYKFLYGNLYFLPLVKHVKHIDLKHLQEMLQSSHLVKFNTFCSIFSLQQKRYFKCSPKICYNRLSYMKAYCSTL